MAAALHSPAKYFTVALASAWVYSLVDMMNTQTKLDSATSGTELRFESALYRAQRNTLLCGAATLLLLVVSRLFNLLKEVNSLAATKEALGKQAEGAAAAYKAISEECDALKKKHGEGGGADASADSARGGSSRTAAADKHTAELAPSHANEPRLSR